jgi:uncharacterized protein YbjT (DUF2867 family)
MSDEMVMVTGATGKTGRRVVRILEERGVAHRAVSRASAIRFDWEDRSTWDAALEGVTSMYLVMAYLDDTDAAEAIAELARRAAAAGVRRAVLLSTPEIGEQGHATEQALEAAGIESTVLRLRWFFQNFSEDFLLHPILSGELRLAAGDGLEGFVDAEDIAEVAVAALTEAGHGGEVYELTGPRLMSFGDAVAKIAKATGNDIRYEALTSEAFVAEQIANGVPEEFAQVLAGVTEQMRSGRFASLTGDVERVLGRPPRDFADYARETAAQGAWQVPPAAQDT